MKIWCLPQCTDAVSALPGMAHGRALQLDGALVMPQPKDPKGGSRLSRPTGKPRSPRSGDQTSPAPPQDQIILGSLVINKPRHLVQLEGGDIHLTPIEFGLLWILASYSGEVCRREKLQQHVWGKGVYVTPRTVDVHMSKLRQKLQMRADKPSVIETVWGIGYRLRD